MYIFQYLYIYPFKSINFLYTCIGIYMKNTCRYACLYVRTWPSVYTWIYIHVYGSITLAGEEEGNACKDGAVKSFETVQL